MNHPVYWPDKSLPLAIFCAPGILTGLEILATDGLLAMPRTGLGIGGLMLGRQSGERLEILRTVAIPCSHAMGPSFVLTPEEIAEVKASDGGMDNALVGWYCSKPNGRMVLSESDEALFDALCGERGQVALLIRPSLGNVTLATFALRGDGRNGDRFQLGTQGELVTPESTPAPEEPDLTAEPELEARDVVPAVEVAPQPVAPEPVRAYERPAIPVMPRGGPLFGVEDPFAERKRRWRRRLLWMVVLLAILAAAAYLTINYLPESGISK